MSGAYSTPQQRSQPAMRSAPQYNVNKFLSDPSAGRRNMQLEVQAVLDQAKPINALVSGGVKIAETLAQADAEEQLTTANLNLRTEVESILADMKAMPIARQSSEINALTGQVSTTLQPVHETSYKSYSAALTDARDRIAKGMNRVARDAFLKGSVNYIAQAQAEAASVNRKQHIKYLQGKGYQAIEGAPTLNYLEQLGQLQWMQLAFDPKDLAKMLNDKARNLAVDHYGYRVQEIAETAPHATRALHEIRRELRDGGASVEQQLNVDDDQVPKINPYFRFLENEDRSKLFSAIQSKIDQIEKNAKTNREDYVNDTLADVLKNPQNYSEGQFQEMLADNLVIGSDYNNLITAWKGAVEGPAFSMPGAVIAYTVQIGDYTIGQIVNDERLTATDKIKFIAKRREYEKGVRAWDDKNNPESDLGYRAVKKLERHFGIVEQGFLSPRARAGAKLDNEEEFIAAYDRLENEVGLNDQIPAKEKPEAAMELVNKILAKRAGPEATDKADNPYQVSNLNLPKLKAFEEEHGSVDSIFKMEASEERSELLRELQKLGVVPQESQLKGKSIEELIEDDGPDSILERIMSVF